MTLASLNNLAAVIQDEGDLSTAKEYFESVLRVGVAALALTTCRRSDAGQPRVFASESGRSCGCCGRTPAAGSEDVEILCRPPADARDAGQPRVFASPSGRSCVLWRCWSNCGGPLRVPARLPRHTCHPERAGSDAGEAGDPAGAAAVLEDLLADRLRYEAPTTRHLPAGRRSSDAGRSRAPGVPPPRRRIRRRTGCKYGRPTTRHSRHPDELAVMRGGAGDLGCRRRAGGFPGGPAASTRPLPSATLYYAQ